MKSLRLATLSVLLLAAFTARAESLVVNGSLNGSIANMDVPTGWTVLAGTPDTVDPTSNVGVSGWLSFGVAPTVSPDGGTWVGLGINGNYIESFGQSLNGLTVGQTYTVSWQAANFGINNQANSYLGSNAIGVMLDGASIGQGSTLSLSSNWSTQSLTFVATSASQLLSFSLASTEKAYLGIDGISVTAGGVAPAVPEPSTWALMAIGLVGMAAMRRRLG
jgi:PEP-CTERM motif